MVPPYGTAVHIVLDLFACRHRDRSVGKAITAYISDGVIFKWSPEADRIFLIKIQLRKRHFARGPFAFPRKQVNQK